MILRVFKSFINFRTLYAGCRYWIHICNKKFDIVESKRNGGIS